MLLELCMAYTEAINSGSVPNIQSAWNYVCQNEHQRLVDNCIARFDQQIRNPLQRAKEENNITILKQAFKQMREDSALQFRKEAITGGDIQGMDTIQLLEIKLRNSLSEKYKTVKQDFIMYCTNIAKKYLEREAQNIRRNIQNAKYENLFQVQDELKSLKENYIQDPKAPIFPGYEIIIAEQTQEIISKASDYLNISHNQTNAIEVKRLQERVKIMDTEIRQNRREHQTDLIDIKVTMTKLETEKTQLHQNMTLNEDRFKRSSDEKNKQVEQLQNEIKTLKELNEHELANVKHKLELNQMESRYADNSQLKKVTEMEKLHALIEQKLHLTEKDLADQKTKLTDKDKDLKELQKSYYQTRIELSETKHKLQE